MRHRLKFSVPLFFSCVMLLAPAIRTSTLHAVPPADGEYRTFDGTNNNLEHPWWGSAGSHLLRGAGGAHYADGISAIGGSGRHRTRAHQQNE